MRVVSGTCKGRPLKAVPGTGTRPTTDKVKESLFNIIGPYFDGGTVLDLFAGSGGLGIEALSRGLDKAIFIDREYKAIQTVRANLEACHFIDQSEVFKNDSERALKAIIKRELVFRLILLDPPYKKQKLVTLLEQIHNARLLDQEGHIVCEHSSTIVLPENVEGFIKTRYEVYGMIAISIYHWNHGDFE
ncbi:16S rRNA (guanine(966)-N(2))-methyltransferase RsmD [Peribacillus cavernae]|uniref:16S rRNA (Guanine(966)-N(2))-methyltransferase RsmD n=1 Tax=Peribacillus cavernae TaxID=1674310 RepID=A0A3S0W901_9BACI|nr:16S rRNA (guanine(966)-N(2))-methyltransferase RsmD [Peribacillus cavernae]MDQ0217195.1 16S rRNA (guanine(966)-N(2))-methyltransferase RsmD [Peribacillus cavernae]RUQ30334.1 16S rRNA (guanine(966)-N(2))-methyltransferase RsmD [Peribacillus cavernae]